MTIFILSEIATFKEHKFKHFSLTLALSLKKIIIIKKNTHTHIYLQHAVTLKLKMHQIRYTDRGRLHFSTTIMFVYL